MKRLAFLTLLAIVTVTAVSGCRLGQRWWRRGAVCETYMPACTEMCEPGCDPMFAPSAPLGMGAFPSTMESLPTVPATR